MTLTVFVGSVNRKSDGMVAGAGLAVLAFDEASLRFEQRFVFEGIDNPTFLTFDEKRSLVYAAAEIPTWPENVAVAFRYDAASGELTYLNSQPSFGSSTCHVSLLPGGRVAVANYTKPAQGPAKAFAIYGTDEEGLLSPALQTFEHDGPLGPRADRQETSHAHMAQPSPDGKLLAVCDLGLDKVVFYRIGTTVTRAFDYAATPGVGPRHSSFSPDGKMLYVVNELTPSVTVLRVGENSLTREQELSIDAPGTTGQNWGAEIRVSPDGKHVYASNRVANTISGFAVGVGGLLELIETVPCGGEWPRNFALTPSGNHMIVACQNSGYLTVLKRDAVSGRLTLTDARHTVATPMRVLPVAV